MFNFRLKQITLSCLILFLVIGFYRNDFSSVVQRIRPTRKMDFKCWYCIDLFWMTNNNTIQSTTKKPTEIPCHPTERIVFLKTHKTGSSTISSILQRFGSMRNLKFAVPKAGHVISKGHFKRTHVRPGTYDLLVNHVRYNREEMEAVTKPGTKYITILRDPATQLESVFGYFRLFIPLHLRSQQNPYRTFISKPQYYLNKYQKFKMRDYLRNPLLYDLGLNRSEQLNISTVKHTIDKLDKEFDLVMLQEYFNESLLLLKKLFCWQWDDILYIIKGERIKQLRYGGDADSLVKHARTWSASDTMLYDHFNITFWNKVKEYGPEFEYDLKILEEKLNETKYRCTQPEAKPKISHRAYEVIPKPSADYLCSDMLKSDIQFTSLIRAKQKLKKS